NGSVLNMQSWETVSSIDVAGGNGLLIDYFCGKDVAICTGENTTSSNSRGGVVRMGHNVMIGGPWPPDNYDVALNINGDEQTGLFVKSVSTTNPYNYGVVSSVNGFNNKAFAVLLQNGNNDKEIISLRGNGEAFFGALTPAIKPTLYVSPSVDANNQLGTGRVGIGTETPATALDVKGDVTVSNLGDGVNTRTLLVNASGQLVPGTASSTTAKAWNVGGNNITNPATEYFGSSNVSDLYIKNGNSAPRIVVKADGKVGIGTPIPSGVLEIKGLDPFPYNSSLVFSGNGVGDIYSSASINFHYQTGTNFTVFEGGQSPLAGLKCFSIENGKTHIGPKKPLNAPYDAAMLSVYGSIVAKEIFVRDDVGAVWADYVFAKDYKLMPLKEVEKYVAENKHLPNVPSAKEIDEKGQGIGSLQIVQMEKIEELYLHLIELSKKVEKLEKENAELKAKIRN
ncbi:MAG: hypothetical protein ACOVJ8_04255, partial [Sediminibacterium sp.]